MFPFEMLLPSHILAILSLVLLAVACIALYAVKLAGAWRPIYVVTALGSLYLNVFVLVTQAFLKTPALHEMNPGNPPNGPVFAVAQGVVLVFFVLMIVLVWRRFKPTPA
jgi:molybdopterin/thiamine biosynthesis adenylyltransferase